MTVGLSKDSVILLEQIRTIDKKRLREHMGHLDEQQMTLVDDAIAVSFGLGANPEGYESAAVATHSSGAVASAAQGRLEGADKGLLG